MQIPKVAVIVTIYNIEKYLDRFFECLKNQSFTDYEALMIDDGSQDGSLDLCRGYAEKDSRIRVFSLEHVGISAARNFAMQQIRTEFVTSLDGDDYFDKDYLKHLIDAQQKYDADMVISNVIFERENAKEYKRFIPRPEAVYTGQALQREIPGLLIEGRLNFLYGKLYRAELLKNIRVEPDVRQGSDTMINFMYLIKINSVAVTEDYDYHYIKYSQRTVTSYRGSDAFARLYRINRFVYDIMEQHGRLDDEMIKAIDARIFNSAGSVFVFIGASDRSDREKLAAMKEITHSEEYLWSYERQKKLGSINELPAGVIVPGTEKYYLRAICHPERARLIGNIKKICPDYMLSAYNKMKIRLGLIPEDCILKEQAFETDDYENETENS